MTISIPLSAAAEDRFKKKAADVGEDVATYLGRLLERLARDPAPLRELSGPLGEEFRRAGMSEDELSDLLEHEKHVLRAERRNSGKDSQ